MVKKGYKQTEIGVIPEDWKVKPAKDLMKIETGSRNTEHKADHGQYPFFVRSQQVERIDSYHYDCEAVLTAGDGVGTGKVFHYIDGKFDAHQRVYVMSNFDGVLGKYFFYFFGQNFGAEVSKYTAKSSVDSVRRDMIAEMLIPIPLEDEQKSIYEAISDTEQLIETLEKQISKKKAIKQGAMQELLTGKRRLPGFSGVWYETTIGEHCSVFDGTHQTPQYTISGIPFYSVENVTANDFHNTKFVAIEEHKRLTAKFRIEKGDILMTRIGSIGKCKYVDWDVNASFYVSLALIKCKDTINAQFLSFYSESDFFKKEIEIRSLLTAIPQKINLGPISEIRLRIPCDTDEQCAIASVLDDMEKEIETLECKLEKYRQVKQGMMQQLLTGKIRIG